MSRRFDKSALLAKLSLRRDPAISPASLNDAPAFAALHAASFGRGWSAEEFEQLQIEPNVIADRAMAGGLAGFVLSRIAADQAEILSIAVASSYRGRGIAGKLMGVHLRRLTTYGVTSVFLEVEERNLAARRLYAGFAYREVGRRQSYYAESDGEPGTALVLRRDIA